MQWSLNNPFLIHRYGTETRHSFEKKLEHSAKEPGPSTNLASKTAQETYKSSVFRHGDWNVAEPHFIKHSVTCNDFHIKPFTTSHNVGSKDTKGQKQEKDELEYTESKVTSISPKGINQKTSNVLCLHCNIYSQKDVRNS